MPRDSRRIAAMFAIGIRQTPRACVRFGKADRLFWRSDLELILTSLIRIGQGHTGVIGLFSDHAGSHSLFGVALAGLRSGCDLSLVR